MQISLMEKTIFSILEVEEADMDDAGIYVCRTSDLQIASARVDVLNGTHFCTFSTTIKLTTVSVAAA